MTTLALCNALYPARTWHHTLTAPDLDSHEDFCCTRIWWISCHRNANPIFFNGDKDDECINFEARKRSRLLRDFEKDLCRLPFCLRRYLPFDVIWNRRFQDDKGFSLQLSGLLCPNKWWHIAGRSCREGKLGGWQYSVLSDENKEFRSNAKTRDTVAPTFARLVKPGASRATECEHCDGRELTASDTVPFKLQHARSRKPRLSTGWINADIRLAIGSSCLMSYITPVTFRAGNDEFPWNSTYLRSTRTLFRTKVRSLLLEEFHYSLK